MSFTGYYIIHVYLGGENISNNEKVNYTIRYSAR